MAVTTAAELQPVASATSKLRGLLNKARMVKSTSTVDPPLPTSPFLEDVIALQDGLGELHDQAYKFGILETAARNIVYTLINSAEILDPAFVEVWNLLDVILMCSDHGQATPELACWLLEELLDSQTTHGCRTVFDYLESRRERLAQKDFHKKNLVFLRSCNELLRRLSRAEDAIFCGRVFFFLFQTFPLGDKSSVNLRGEFHVENTTKFEVSESESTQNGDKMEIDVEPVKSEAEASKASTPQPPSKPGSKALPIKGPPKKEEEVLLDNSDLYPIFWRLQQDFSEPTRLFAPDQFQRFKKGLAYTITKFKKTQTVVQALAVEDPKHGVRRRLIDDNEVNGGAEPDGDHFAKQYNPKYLTSRDLFDLELSDQSFQRHVMVQSLILIDFLLSLTEKAKNRVTALGNPNKSMLYNFTLNEDDSKWAVATRKTISDYLSTSPDGKLFNRMVDTVLARDKNWIKWKVESCPSIVRGPVTTQSEFEARQGTKSGTKTRHVSDAPVTAVNLSFLVENSQKGLKALKNPLRYTKPPLQELRTRLITDRLDLEMEIEGTKEYTELRNQEAGRNWRIVRQARANDLGRLKDVEPDSDLAVVFGPQENTPPDQVADSEDLQQGDDVAEVVPSAVFNGQTDGSIEAYEQDIHSTNVGVEETADVETVETEQVRMMEDMERESNVMEDGPDAT